MSNLAFSTDFRDHSRLLHQFANKSMGRMQSLGIHLEHDDAYQEACLSAWKASKTFNPENGNTFTAYMGRSVWNNFNNSVASVIAEQEAFGMVSVEDMMVEDWESVASSDLDTVEDKILRMEESRERIAKFDAKGKAILRDLISPSQALVTHHKGMLEHARHARVLFKENGEGRRPYCPSEITLRFITKFHGVSYVGFLRQVKEKLGIDIR